MCSETELPHSIHEKLSTERPNIVLLFAGIADVYARGWELRRRANVQVYGNHCRRDSI